MDGNKDLLISLFSQSLEQINAVLPEANIRDLLAIAKESLAMYSKVKELESELPDTIPIATTDLISQLQKELQNIG
ncbi:MAG: hypothetical protein ACRDBG_02955 [Waterburya sp.]